jgi:hypothetical protein
MITAIIPTKDRAPQLDILLQSLSRLNFIDNIVVLWKASSDKFKQGYQKAFDNNDVIDVMVEEKNFYEDYFKSLDYCDDYVLGLTDDTFVYREAPFNQAELLSTFSYDTLCVSLRLGLNTVIQDIANPNKMFSIPQEEELIVEGGKFLRWDWQKVGLDWNTGYPISLDGHIYKKEVLTNLSKAVEFKNLREWEGNLVYYAKENLKSLNKMVCWEKSLCVNIPINMVQPPYNINVSPFAQDYRKMNEEFINGERFYVDYKENEIKGSHWYLPLQKMGI